METSTSVDLSQVARELNLSQEAVERTIALLDDDNTVAFITRFRKDHTGGLDEEQIRSIESRVGKLRLLAERKATIRKSIESQNKLTDELAGLIDSAQSNKRLEDLYLPYKPKKQTLTTAARERGLEPLAEEILQQKPEATDLDERAKAFVDADKGIASPAEVLLGVGHLVAEHFSESAELRGRLRKILWRTGKLTTSQVPPPKEVDPEEKPVPSQAEQATPAVQAPSAAASGETVEAGGENPSTEASAEKAAGEQQPEQKVQGGSESGAGSTSSTVDSSETPSQESNQTPEASAPSETSSPTDSTEAPTPEATGSTSTPEISAPSDTAPPESPLPSPEASSTAASGETPSPEAPAPEATPAASSVSEQPAAGEVMPAVATKVEKPAEKPKKERKKKKKPPKQSDAFKDYYDFNEALTRLPPHRVMAINRGERAKAIRVRVDCDLPAMQSEAEQLLVPEGHMHADFLRSCVGDALSRLVVPSLEREARRELTEKAEDHAIEVFAQNLRKLLLQPPLRGRRVLAIDPGFRSGCKIAVIDAYGEVLDHATVHVVGREERRKSGRSLLVGLTKKYNVSVMAIGNGAASREAEQVVSSVINEELNEFDVSFVIVNEAGASIYSTSPVGREEFPKYDPTVRSAISIGRRLLDPLSELVKINPAHIGVGMYQHDVKSKHLRDTLDAVVASCVNYVGVDANTASPSLLKYVSGLNQLHARRIYEHRQEHGPYKRRGQIMDAPHIGESTYDQAAGFLKIPGGEHPLDVTWIHPESYDLAEQVLAKVGVSLDDLKLKLPPDAEAYGLAGEKPVAEETPAEGEAAPIAKPAPAVASEKPAESPSEQEQSAQAVQGSGESEEGSPSATVDSSESVSQQPDNTPEAAAPSETAPADSPLPSSLSPEAEAPDATSPDAPATAATPAASSSEEPAPAPSPPAPKPKSEVQLQAEARAAARGAWEAALAEQRAKFESLSEKVAGLNVEELAKELGVGQLSLKYLLKAITRPGRDPRDDLPQPVLRRGILKLEDLQSGMELTGTVLNVVDFGAFVDIGLTDSGLVHISRLADRYVSDPHEVVSVGDVIQVWVMEVDTKRRRVSLTAIEPGTEKPKEEHGRGRGKKPEAAARSGQGGKPSGRRDRPPRKGKGGRDQKRASTPRAYELEAKPKESKPLKKKVLEGKEPMRSFSDLVQFLGKDEKPGSDQSKKKKK